MKLDKNQILFEDVIEVEKQTNVYQLWILKLGMKNSTSDTLKL